MMIKNGFKARNFLKNAFKRTAFSHWQGAAPYRMKIRLYFIGVLPACLTKDFTLDQSALKLDPKLNPATPMQARGRFGKTYLNFRRTKRS
jgi:hypothetical protein